MKLTIVEKNLPSWTAMHIDFSCAKRTGLKPSFSYFKGSQVVSVPRISSKDAPKKWNQRTPRTDLLQLSLVENGQELLAEGPLRHRLKIIGHS